MAQQYSFVYLYNDFSEIAAICRDNYDDYLLDYDKVRDFVVSNSWYNMGGKIKELTLLEPSAGQLKFIIMQRSTIRQLAMLFMLAVSTMRIQAQGANTVNYYASPQRPARQSGHH
ncbi:hypothetical protein ACQ86N_19395 [Puia sp. P3]|uniref:hypothetical protein n=1 Tax=Puia sp. P3 TaxID=3423952 RepID=UPI003D6678FC